MLDFSCFAFVEFDTDLQVWSNPNQSNKRSAVILPLMKYLIECSMPRIKPMRIGRWYCQMYREQVAPDFLGQKVTN